MLYSTEIRQNLADLSRSDRFQFPSEREVDCDADPKKVLGVSDFPRPPTTVSYDGERKHVRSFV